MHVIISIASTARTGIGFLSEFFHRLSIAFVILLMVFMTVEVGSRYVLRSSTSWSFELSTLSFGAIFLFGTAATLKYGHHVRMDLLYQRFSLRWKNIVDSILYVVFLLPCLFWVTRQVWQRFWETLYSGETTGYSAWNPPLWPFTLVIALGVTVLMLQVVAEAFKVFTSPAQEGEA